MSIHRTTKLEMRCTPDEKARWQREADAEGVNLSTLVRTRMIEPTELLDADADELTNLRAWLALDDCDGEVDAEQLAGWRAFAAAKGVTFSALLRTSVVAANVEYL